jgi:hypothetical protein
MRESRSKSDSISEIWKHYVSSEDKFFEDEFYNGVFHLFTKYSYSRDMQSLILYDIITNLNKIVEKSQNPQFIITSLLYLNGLLRIVNDNSKLNDSVE